MTTTDDAAVLERERRLGRGAGIAALLSVAAMVVAMLLAGAAVGGSTATTGAGGDGADRAQRLTDFDQHASDLAVSTGLRCVAFLLMVAVGLHVYRLVRTRDETAVKPFVLALTVAGPAAVVVAAVVVYLASKDVADGFANALATLVPTPTGDRADDLAKGLVDDSNALTIATGIDIVSRVLVAVWFAFLAVGAMRVGLLSRFLGYWGVAGGVALVLLPVGDAMLAAWLASVGILALGFWPGGRPAAWDSTEPQEIEAV